ncbi:MAG: hypothetical protein IPJ19_03100 [Planctomycetes bacterium]|nr:hypothetical protein [Planctomycetota bacterium]
MPSRARLTEELLEPLRRVLGWLCSLRDAQGRLVCPEHGVEHTGKNAYVIVLCCELARHDPRADRAALCAIARGQAQRLVANLVREGTSPCHTFRPGRHDPFNCSNSVIDGGAASDALAQLVHEFGPELPAQEREAAAAASLLHARSYLRYAVLDKGIPAQRAWGLTGLAGAWSLEHDADLERAAIEAVGMLEAIQHPDGSYPYHPLEWGAEHPGAADVSSFYHSRLPAFLMYALERLGRDPRDELFRGPILRALEFLLALVGPDGTKPGLLEAKPWYWGAEYEVASNPFDVYALASGWRLFGRRTLGESARAAFRAWAAHLSPEGRPASHHPAAGRERSYQCAVFWAAHAAWIARAAPALAECLQFAERPVPGPGAIEISVSWFADAQLARLEDAGVVAWVRGARAPSNVHHGSPRGAGLLRVWSKREARELLERSGPGGEDEAEWHAQAGSFAPSRGWRSGARELRFAGWLARVDWRAGRYTTALARPGRVFSRGVLDYGAPLVSSAFDRAPRASPRSDGIELSGHLAHRDGTPLVQSRLERSFRIGGGALEVEERVLDAGGARGLEYHVPQAARELVREKHSVRYHLGS